jgi:1-deoxy-D-xylulose-5-phosphate synthase
MMGLLENIHSPADLKQLAVEQLPQLAQEIRARIVGVVSQTGGHLASSLGAVELVVALHYCLNTPEDKLIFDVGHQAYAHKILTGRNKDFDTLRQFQGISGFPCRDESEHDPFTTGHSSTAVSLALGLACARDALGPAQKPFKVVAVIGDGSLSGGLCFEGLNNAGHLKKSLLIILNTNEMSIAPNVGSLSNYLNKFISLPIYNRFRDSLEHFVQARVPRAKRVLALANKFEEGLKGLFIPGMFFEELGFRYFGPLDGHDLNTLVPTLKNILTVSGPRLLHVVTKKGKGYPPAESEPVRFHGTGPFKVETGKALKQPGQGAKTYTEVFGAKLMQLAQSDRTIVAITAAMPEGTGLDKFRDNLGERFFDVGIAEGHAVCFAGGLARMGLKPLVAIYSTFLSRGYDQIIENVALQRSPVVFAVDRAGIVGDDGMTHQGLFDIAFLRSVPDMVLMSPKNAEELELMLEASFQVNGPVAIRYPRALCPLISLQCEKLAIGKAEVLEEEGDDFVVFALGSMVVSAYEAAKILRQEGLSGTVINARFVKPLDQQLFEKMGRKSKHLFTIEEGAVEGGFGSAVAEALNKPVVRIGLPNEFICHGKRDILLERYGLSVQAIANRIKLEIKAMRSKV